MLTVRFVKNYKDYRRGDKAEFINNEAIGLVELGVGKIDNTPKTVTKPAPAETYEAKIIVSESPIKTYRTKHRTK